MAMLTATAKTGALLMLISTRTADFLTRIASKLIYGTIILGTVIGSLSDPLPGNLRVIVTVFLSLQAVSIAGAYARSIDQDMANRRPTPWRVKWNNLLRPDWVVASTVVPIGFFALALAGVISQPAALAATKVVLLALLLLFGVVAHRLSGAGFLPSVLAGFAVTLLGFGVVQIKLWTKYLPSIGY